MLGIRSVGSILADGTNTTCVGDCPQWKGIGYRYLAAALRDDPARTAYRAVLEASVEAAWTLARNATTGYFANDWAGPPMTTASIEAQSSTAMAMNLFAALCGAYAAPPSASYEAEDAVLDHVALEEVNSGFSGWGYVAAWSANNQTVEFTVQVPTATDYRAEFSYAAAGGEAARVLYVRGTMASPRLSIDRRVDELGPCFGDGAPRRRRELDQARLRNGTKQREPAEPRSPDDPPDVKRRSGSDDQNQLVLMPARTSSGAYVDCEPTRWAACDLRNKPNPPSPPRS